MEHSISEQIQDATEEISSSKCVDATLNMVLNRFLTWPLRANTGVATDADGRATGNFASVIYTDSKSHQQEGPVNIPADALACVVDVIECLDLEQLRHSYAKIATAKALRKTPVPETKDVPVSNTTLGIIFARGSVLSMEQLAEELDSQNRQTPSAQWPDMVVVLSVGVINYSVQFPGTGMSGDFLPPAEGALTSYTLPAYILIVLRPTGVHSFRKMIAFVLGHLSFFSPGVKLPDWSEVTKGIPKEALVLRGYQYNLSGQLLPVPREFYNDRYIAPQTFLIEDNKGNVLSTLQFLPWQDGGVISLKGKLPLSGLLVFLGKQALQRGGVVKPPNAPDTQVSYVLPITQNDFTQMLQRLQRQSNLRVRSPQSNLVVQKVADEGASSLFMARLFIGILHLRDAIFPDPLGREEFDKEYQFVAMTLLNTRASMEEIVRLLVEHKRKVLREGGGRVQGHTIYVDESINNALSKEVCTFLDSAVRVLKDGMQKVTKVLQTDIGFLFAKDKLFVKGLEALSKSDAPLTAYLRETRSWSGQLIQCRNSMHGGWMLPQLRYSRLGDRIVIEEPHILGQPLTEFIRFMTDRLICFVEEVTAHTLQARMSCGISMVEIPASERSKEVPERFKLTLVDGQAPVWRIAYHPSPFDKT